MDNPDFALDGHGPLHDQIRRSIAAAILSGQLGFEQRIPSEEALTEHFGASRMTVNRALRALSEAGLIVRRRRAGSFVARHADTGAILDIPDIPLQAASAGRAYRHSVLKRAMVTAEDEVAQRLGVAAGTSLLYVQCLHVIEGVPNNVEERWINPATAPGVLDADFAVQPPGTWLLRHVPWTGAEHTISAVNAGAELALRLEMAAGDACLVIARRTWKADGFVTFVRLTYPGSRQSFIGRFGPHAPVEQGAGG
jgi:GntR family histidine utilization transcriptional repressor